jgi:hypothetical protein
MAHRQAIRPAGAFFLVADEDAETSDRMRPLRVLSNPK